MLSDKRYSVERESKVLGPDRCLFGTERPVTGSALDPVTGHYLNDLRPIIKEIGFLSPAHKTAIFEGNARAFFSRLTQPDRGSPNHRAHFSYRSL